ncbi:hypothetical protein Tco_0611613 [Tanacetum coccineum]
MSGHQYTQELLQGNNLQCTELIRMSRDSFVRLCNHFKEKNWLRDSKHISVEEKMFIFLMIIGHNERFSVMKRRFQHSKETIHNCFHEVLDKMLVFSEEVIRPTTFNPNPNIPENNRRERQMFKGVVGALDGTLIHASVPSHKQNVYRARGRDGKEMLNLSNSNQDPLVDLYDLKGSDEGDNMIDSLTMKPSDTFLIGDKVISTTPEREIDEFIKSSVDDLVPIPRDSEVTSVYDDLECSMPLDFPPSPRLDVSGERKVDINLPFGEHLDTLLMEDREIDFNPRDIETNDLIPVPRVFDEPLGGTTRVMETFSSGFHHMPSPCLAAYSPKEVMYRYCPFLVHRGDDLDHGPKIPSGESKVHIEVLSGLWGNRLPIPDGSPPLSRTPDVSVFKRVEEILEVEIRLLALSVRTPDVLVV